MKKQIAASLAALTFFSVFAFTACSPSKEEKNNAADEIIAKFESSDFAGTSSEEVMTVTDKSSFEKVLTKTGEKLSSSENTSSEKTVTKITENFADGECDLSEENTSGGETVYNYEFYRGGHTFTHTSRKAVENFSSVKMEVSEDGLATDSPEFMRVNSVLLSAAKAADALELNGEKLIVDLNAVAYSVVSDLNYIFDNTDGNITLGGVFGHERIKKYFDGKTYGKITEALSSKDVYIEAAEIIYDFSGGLISLPQAENLANINLTDGAKDFKENTRGVTREKFVISKTEKDINTQNDTALMTEQSISLSFSDAKITFAPDGEKGINQILSLTLNLEMLDKEDYSLSYAPEKSYVSTRREVITYAVDEKAEYSGDKYSLADISKATVEYGEYEVADGEYEKYISYNQAPVGFYGKLVDGEFAGTLKVYTDIRGNITEVVAEPYSFGAQFTSSYNSAERSVTLTGGKFQPSVKLYLSFDNRTENGETFLYVKVYGSAADRDANRLCVLSGAYLADFPLIEENRKYYPVYLNYNTATQDYIKEADVTFKDGNITNLRLSGYGYDTECAYSAADGKITVKVMFPSDDTLILTYYAGIVSDGEDGVTVGIYADKSDARSGSDDYECYFDVQPAYVAKTVKVEEYILKF